MAAQRRRSTRRADAAQQPRASPRAPRRAGARTTLRVPGDLAETVARYAEQHRTSTNDALVRLALDGAASYERRRQIAELAAVRQAAITELSKTAAPPGADLLPGDDTERAILGFRLGLVDEEQFGA